MPETVWLRESSVLLLPCWVRTEAAVGDAVPRDRSISFEPKIFAYAQHRLASVDDLVICLVAKGMTRAQTASGILAWKGTLNYAMHYRFASKQDKKGSGPWTAPEDSL